MNEFFYILISMAPQQGGAGGGGGALMGFAPLVFIFVIFYFLLIRPQQKKAKDHQSFLDTLEKGTDVVTNGGIIGRITGITRNSITIEISPKVKVKFLKNAISGKAPQLGDESEIES